MRINIYTEELTKEVTLVSKTAADTGIEYYGVRMYVASLDDTLDDDEMFHNTLQSKNRPAITFWFPNNETFTHFDLVAHNGT